MKRVIKSAESTSRLIAKSILEKYTDEQKHFVTECMESEDQAAEDAILSDEEAITAMLQEVHDSWKADASQQGLTTPKEFEEIYNALCMLND